VKFLSLALSTLLLGAAFGIAQEPPLPAATTTPSASPTAPVRPDLNIPDIPMTVEPAPLVPNTSAVPKKNVPSITELDSAFQGSSLGQAVEQQKLQLEWRKLKNRVAENPEIKAAQKAIESADTELEKRNRRRAYYKLYYGRMQALAETPALKSFLEQKKNEILASLDQPHVRPATSPAAKSPNN
jgi:hypothetical protein